MWGGGFSSWPEVLWRRSALQFLSDMMLLMGPELGVCPSVTGRVTRCVDEACVPVHAFACILLSLCASLEQLNPDVQCPSCTRVFFKNHVHPGDQTTPLPSCSCPARSELERLDDAMRSVDGEASDLACCRRPEGLPLKHWWYSLTGSVGAGTLC